MNKSIPFLIAVLFISFAAVPAWSLSIDAGQYNLNGLQRPVPKLCGQWKLESQTKAKKVFTVQVDIANSSGFVFLPQETVYVSQFYRGPSQDAYQCKAVEPTQAQSSSQRNVFVLDPSAAMLSGGAQ